MKYIRAIIATATILVAATPVFAGTVVTNSTSNRNTEGHGKTEFSSLKNSVGSQDNFSQSIKVESYAPNASATATLKDGKLSGTATGSTSPINPDPIAIIVNSSQSEKLNFTQTDATSGYEKYDFTGYEYNHSVNADSF